MLREEIVSPDIVAGDLAELMQLITEKWLL
jgi:hypothetical protein